MIRLIVSDVDGTLVPEGGNDPDPHLFDSILKLKSMGIRFAVASGRQYESILSVFHPVKEDVVFIADNGSLLIDRGKILYSNTFDGDVWKRIVRFVKQIPGAEYMVSSMEGTFSPSRNAHFLRLLGDGYGVKMEFLPDVTEKDIHVSKVAVYCTGTDPLILAEEGRKLFGNSAYVVASGTNWVDYMAPGASKGAAVRTLQKLLDIRSEETMAFGDNYNDIGLFEAAGESYAVAAAPQEVKAAALHVLDGGPEENAVLHILKNMVKPL